MRIINFLLAIIVIVGCQSPKKSEDAKQRPNILFIMTDDHTTQAMSCYGSELIETPNLDRIANEGMRFDNCYVTNAICAPSRAVIMTGKFSHVNGVTDNAKVFNGMQQTYPKILQKAGYQTAMIGKWHLGSSPTGFDYWSVLPGQGNYYQPEFIEMGDTITVDGYVTDVITDKAIKWLKDRNDQQPFAMVYQHKAPHRNWMPAPRHLGVFEDKVFPKPETLFDDYQGRGSAAREQEMEIGQHMWDAWDFKLASKEELDKFGANNTLAAITDAKHHDVAGANKREDDLKKLYRVYSRMTKQQQELWHKAYAKRIAKFKEDHLSDKELLAWKYQLYMRDYMACLLSLDENVGRLLKHLEESGELDNTIVVYTSDQGFFLGEHGWFDKRIMYEECYRMPLLVRYPKAIKAGTQSSALAMNLDFAPTFLDYAGLDVPKDMQGVSLRPVFENEGLAPKSWREATYYHYYEYPSWHSVKRHYGMRTNRYKLIHFYNDVDEWELYDMEKDPQELSNVIYQEEYKAIAQKLKEQLKQLQAQYKDDTAEANEM
ncbi:sulfatase [Carboxylicivirga sp. M1479]|uniref:sulfatase family protein n=1 Tax=Carboxylicivirga sp. M1479 TaxID=2594476 RepID=UPI001177C93D|nr:sulfatase [Carboxylicivirga sp. M1479]TRX66415.1 sulfatase [Carboxylicivirga sp. M1479]